MPEIIPYTPQASLERALSRFVGQRITPDLQEQVAAVLMDWAAEPGDYSVAFTAHGPYGPGETVRVFTEIGLRA